MSQSDNDAGPGTAPGAAGPRTAAALRRRVATVTHRHPRGGAPAREAAVSGPA